MLTLEGISHVFMEDNASVIFDQIGMARLMSTCKGIFSYEYVHILTSISLFGLPLHLSTAMYCNSVLLPFRCQISNLHEV